MNPLKKPLPGLLRSALLSLAGLLSAVWGSFVLLNHDSLPGWVVFALAVLVALVAWWQTGCIRADLPVDTVLPVKHFDNLTGTFFGFSRPRSKGEPAYA
jgi:hypothetical protein